MDLAPSAQTYLSEGRDKADPGMHQIADPGWFHIEKLQKPLVKSEGCGPSSHLLETAGILIITSQRILILSAGILADKIYIQ